VNRDEAARQITESVAQLFFSTENQTRFHGASEELGLNPPMLKALIQLEPGDGLAMRDLAEQWGCDASFVTVVCDALESAGFAERRVAPHDRRIKTVELTEAGAQARARAVEIVYGPRAGFEALSRDEQITLATLLQKVADAQATYDETLLDQPGVRTAARRMAAQRTREVRGRAEGRVPGGTWRQHLEAHHREISSLREELARVRDEIKAQARRPLDDAKAAKADIKARTRRPVDEAKAAKADIKAEVKGVRDEVVNHLKGGRRRR
jgi:DNA-binding MarR family transcriptional regulator